MTPRDVRDFRLAGVMLALAAPLGALLAGALAGFRNGNLALGAAVGLATAGAEIALVEAAVGRPLRTLGRALNVARDHARAAATFGVVPSRIRVSEPTLPEAAACARAFNELGDALAPSTAVASAMRALVEAVSSSSEMERFCRSVLDVFGKRADAQAGAVFVARDGELVTVAEWNVVSASNLASSDVVRRAITRRKRVRTHVERTSVLRGSFDKTKPREVIAMPIVTRGVPIGVVVLAARHAFAPGAEQILDAFTPMLGVAIQHAIAREQLSRLATIDPLTGAFTKRFGLRRLREELLRALRAGTSVGIILFDVDECRSINETHGRLAGDRVIANVARAARTTLRETDVLARYDGAQFLAILPGAARDDTAKAAERVRAAVMRTKTHEDGEPLSVTISIGVNAFPHDLGSGEEEIVSHAAEALVRAKLAGRNRIEVAILEEDDSDPPPRPVPINQAW